MKKITRALYLVQNIEEINRHPYLTENNIPVGVLLKETHLLQLLQGRAGDGARAASRHVRAAATAHLAAGEDLGEATNAHGGAHVNVAGGRSAAHVEPVRVVRAQLLVSARLGEVNPLGGLYSTTKEKGKEVTRQKKSGLGKEWVGQKKQNKKTQTTVQMRMYGRS